MDIKTLLIVLFLMTLVTALCLCVALIAFAIEDSKRFIYGIGVLVLEGLLFLMNNVVKAFEAL